MKKKCVTEFVLILILANFVVFLSVVAGVLEHISPGKTILLGLLVIFVMLISYLLQFFWWTGEDKTVYIIEKNNRSYLLTWFCVLIIYTLSFLFFHSNKRIIAHESILLAIIYIIFRTIFLNKNERNFLENETLIKEYSQNTTFLLFAYAVLINVFIGAFSRHTILFLLFIILTILSYSTIMGIHIQMYKGRLHCKEFYVYIFELVLGICGVYIARIAELNLLCFGIFIITFFIFCIGVAKFDSKTKNKADNLI